MSSPTDDTKTYHKTTDLSILLGKFYKHSCLTRHPIRAIKYPADNTNAPFKNEVNVQQESLEKAIFRIGDLADQAGTRDHIDFLINQHRQRWCNHTVINNCDEACRIAEQAMRRIKRFDPYNESPEHTYATRNAIWTLAKTGVDLNSDHIGRVINQTEKGILETEAVNLLINDGSEAALKTLWSSIQENNIDDAGLWRKVFFAIAENSTLIDTETTMALYDRLQDKAYVLDRKKGALLCHLADQLSEPKVFSFVVDKLWHSGVSYKRRNTCGQHDPVQILEGAKNDQAGKWMIELAQRVMFSNDYRDEFYVAVELLTHPDLPRDNVIELIIRAIKREPDAKLGKFRGQTTTERHESRLTKLFTTLAQLTNACDERALEITIWASNYQADSQYMNRSIRSALNAGLRIWRDTSTTEQ
jgi:hypothetical protein